MLAIFEVCIVCYIYSTRYVKFQSTFSCVLYIYKLNTSSTHSQVHYHFISINKTKTIYYIIDNKEKKDRIMSVL